MSRITRRQFLLGAGMLVAGGVGAAAGLSGNRWWERPPERAGSSPPVEPPNRWSVEARYYASFSGEGALNCAACHGTTEEALRAVPQSFRVGSSSLGGTRWQTVRRVVLPQALPWLLTGVILGLERAAGETAPILFTVAAFFLPRLPHSPLDATMALPYHLFVISTQVPSMPIKIQYGTALVLITFVLGMNIIATVIRSRARARRQW